MVHSGPAWLGLEFYGCHRPDLYGPSFLVWRIQIPARIDLDCGSASFARDSWTGLHGPGFEIRSVRLLGSRNRSLDCQPRAVDGTFDRQANARRTDYFRS